MTTYVQVPVPEEHVPAIFDLIARLQKGEPALPLAPGPDSAPEPTEELVDRVYRESQATHRALLEHLAAHAGRWVPSSELVDALRLPNGSKSAAGMFGAFGRRSNHRYGGFKPWDNRWDPTQQEVSYRMNPDVAGWVREAVNAGTP